MANSFAQSFGGKGANQAVQAAKLSPSPNYVSMLGMVGSDSYGSSTRANFQSCNVGVDELKVGKQNSGLATIQVDSHGENRICIVPGANFELSADDVASMSATISAASYMVGQFEILPTTTAAGFKLAKFHNLTTILNPAPAKALSTLPAGLLSDTDYLVPNQPELSLLSGLPTSTVPECVTAARALISMYSISSCIVTMGSHGSLHVTSTSTFHSPCPPLPGPLLDTVGAGDSFLGALVYYLSRGVELKEAMGRANGVAGYSVGGKGAQTSYKSRDELPEEFRR